MSVDEQHDVYSALAKAQAVGLPVAMATVVHTTGSMPRHAGAKMIVHVDGTIIGTVGGGAMEAQVIEEAKSALVDGENRLKTYTLNSLDDGDPGICGGTAQIFIEPIGVLPVLLIIGGGHVGKALAELGRWAGYRVILSDDREEYCNASYIPDLADYVVCKPAEVIANVKMTPQTYVAAVTRGLPVDIDLIPSLLATSAPYIGLIGSRRRWAITLKALKERGLDDEQLRRIHAPIGLELEAETPKEIAVSILAEIIMIRRGGTGKPMQWIGDIEEATS